MKTPLLLLTLALLAGCSTGRIKTPSGVVINTPKDASAPSSVKEGQKVVTTAIPAGTVVVRENVASTPESPAIERETTTYTAPSQRVETETKSEMLVAPPRAPDVSVAMRNADNKARSPMLYAAISCVLLTAFLLYRGKLDTAVVSGSAAAALALLWYAFSSPVFMVSAFGLFASGVGFLIWSQNKKAMKTEEALRRTVQTVQELGVDQPKMAAEIKEYQDANLDTEHKSIVQALKHTTNQIYLRERFAKLSTQS